MICILRLKRKTFVFVFSKETTFKPPTVLTIEQQRERERQRLKDEEERRKKILARKDHQQIAQIQPVPKFEPLTVDFNNEESRPIKSKTPTTGTGTFSPHFPLTSGATTKLLNKPKSITPVSRPNNVINYDENDPNNNNETGATAVIVPTPVPKKFVIKKRSTILVRLIIHIFMTLMFLSSFFSASFIICCD
jgi:hypothetical protein